MKIAVNHTNNNTDVLSCDIVILGAGIAGLWTLHRLAALGLSVIMVEPESIGGGQTIKSQGIIHGGLKYALTGTLSPASEAISRMPQLWQDCLAGQGEVPLQGAKVLSDAQYLWSTGGLRSGLISFFASRALKGRVTRVLGEALPSVFRAPEFRGVVYQLKESVLDVPSVLQCLSEPFKHQILKVDETEGYKLVYAGVSEFAKTSEIARTFASDRDSPDIPIVDYLHCRYQGRDIKIKAAQYIFTAGIGNQSLSHLSGVTKTQERPLHMVWCTFPGVAPPLYGHCMDNAIQPRITVTTHHTQDGRTVWYLGGALAESGVERDISEQIAEAKRVCSDLFPWVDFSAVEWGTLRVNRAEPQQANGQKPDTAQVEQYGNMLLAWPTKLALAPVMATMVCQHLARIPRTLPITPQQLTTQLQAMHWPLAPMAVPPWDEK